MKGWTAICQVLCSAKPFIHQLLRLTQSPQSESGKPAACRTSRIGLPIGRQHFVDDFAVELIDCVDLDDKNFSVRAPDPHFGVNPMFQQLDLFGGHRYLHKAKTDGRDARPYKVWIV
jgi:hypothetical protein